MAYGELKDVCKRLLRPFNSTIEEEYASLLLDDVERMIRRRIPDLDDKLTEGTLLLADVQAAESSAVARVLRNPDAFVEETDGNYSYRRDPSENGLSLTEDEWESLGLIKHRGMFSVALRGDLPWELPPYDDLWWQRYGEWT